MPNDLISDEPGDEPVVQRSISAASAPPAITAAPNSVFALGAAAAAVAAESAVDVPSPQRARRHFTEQDFLDQFAAGDALSIPQVAKRLDVSASVADRYVKRLAASGQLREVGANAQGAAQYEHAPFKGWGKAATKPKRAAKAPRKAAIKSARKAAAKAPRKPSGKPARKAPRRRMVPAAAPAPQATAVQAVAVRSEATNAAVDDDNMVVGLLSSGELLIECNDAPNLRLTPKRTRALWMYLKQLDRVLQA